MHIADVSFKNLNLVTVSLDVTDLVNLGLVDLIDIIHKPQV